MRRITAAAAACTLGLAAVLTGCSTSPGGTDNSKDKPEGQSTPAPEASALSGDVTVWMYPVVPDEAQHRAYWDKQISDFQDANPDVKVTVEIFPWAERDAAISSAIASSTNPDAIYLIPDQLVTYAAALADMASLLPADHVADLLDSAKNGVTYEGTMLGSPILMQSVPFLCNAAAFEKAGLDKTPETWDELREMAPKLKEAGVYALAYDGATDALNHSFYPLLWQAGGHVFTESGDGVDFNSDAGKAALGLVKEFVDNGWIEKDNVINYPTFEQSAAARGEVGCLIGSYGSIGEIADSWGPENTVVGVLSDAEKVAYGAVGSLALFENSKSMDATTAFINYVTTGEPLEEYLKLSGFFSPLASTGDLFAGDPVNSAVAETLPFVTVGELNSHAREVMGILQPEIQAALLGEKSVDDALKDAAAEAEYLF